MTYLKRICRLGSASFIIQISVVFIIIVVNNLLIRFGAKSEYGPEIPSTMRQIGFMVPAQIIMAYVMGVTGILWGGVIAAGLSFILNVIMLRRCMKIKS